MIRTFAIAAVAVLGASASVEAPAVAQGPSSGGGLTPQEVSAGFVIAVVEGCAAAAEANKTLEQLASDKFVRETGPTMTGPPKPGAVMWAPKTGQGIVSIEEVGGKCNVSAYGPPVAVTFAPIISALVGKSYVAEPAQQTDPRSFYHTLKLTAEGRTVVVGLGGNEPGAPGMRSRFSTVFAFISVTTP
jgi:hypothetical protein